MFNTGAVLNVSTLPNFSNLNTSQLAVQEIRILVDTSIARTIILPYSSSLPTTRNLQVTIIDVTGTASINNITVQASSGSPNDAINGTSTSVINQNFQANRYEFVSANEWAVINASAGGGGGTPLSVSMTYAQLITAIGSSALITGQQILLTDYQTASYIQFSGSGGGGVGGEQVHIGATEPLLLTAISSNELSLFATSISNSQDTILYVPTMTDGHYEYAAAQGKGCIIYRRDNSLNISRDYDFRAVVFRRWETVIGNGHFWSYQPVSGAAHQDYLSYNLSAAILSNNTIGSPLAGHAALGYPYWLDNILLLSSLEIGSNNMSGVASTFTESTVGDGVFGLNNINSIYSLVVCNLVVVNSINSFAQNSLIDLSGSATITNNAVTNFTGNSTSILAGINNNTLESLYGNAIALIQQNCGGQITSNTNTDPSAAIVNNSGFSFIDVNTSLTISGNMVSRIESNSCAVTQNVGLVISNNTCSNSQGVVGNSVSVIDENSNTTVQNNQGSEIRQNANGGVISYNNCTSIVSNTNTVDISGNIADTINNNSGNITNISGNIATAISGNTSVGDILNNNFSGGIIDISGSCNIEGNVGVSFQANVVSGNIKSNNNLNVTSSTITNSIQNTTFNGSINGKTVSPTAHMIAGNPSIVLFDYGLDEFVEQILNAGVVTYSGAITS